jgi:hypothetical protein
MAFCPFVFRREAVAAPATNTCKLPPGLSDVISKKYPGTSLVELTDLSAEDKAFFRKDHGTRCPGLVTVDFYGDGRPTWAVVYDVRKIIANPKTRCPIGLHTLCNDLKGQAEAALAKF